MSKREETTIHVNTEPIEKLVRQNEQMSRMLENKETELESVKEKFRKVGEKILAEKKEQLGCDDPNVQSISDLKLWQAENKDVGVRSGGGSSGRSTLNDDGQQSDNQSFNSRKSLIENIPEGTKNKLWEKTIQGIKEKDGKLAMDFSDVEKEFGNVGVGYGRDRRNEKLRKKLLEGRK
jgi:hypothetical protein